MILDLKKIYYYAIALLAFFILIWGMIDFVSAKITVASGLTISPDKSSETQLEEFYQKKVSQDRMADSLARVLVSGIIFAYARFTIVKLERS